MRLSELKCLRCGANMYSIGRMVVKTGISPEVRGIFADPLLVGKERSIPLELFICDNCGKVEFQDASERGLGRE